MKLDRIARRSVECMLLCAITVLAMTVLTIDSDSPGGSTDKCLNGTIVCLGVR